MTDKNLQDFSKEELIALCEKQENDIKNNRELHKYYAEQNEKLKAKLTTIENILKL